MGRIHIWELWDTSLFLMSLSRRWIGLNIHAHNLHPICSRERWRLSQERDFSGVKRATSPGKEVPPFLSSSQA